MAPARCRSASAERRLAGSAVADQGHVADLLGRKELHSAPPRCRQLRVQGRVARAPTLARGWVRARCACPTGASLPSTTWAIPAARPSSTSTARPTPASARPPDDDDAAGPECGCSPSTAPGPATATPHRAPTWPRSAPTCSALLDHLGLGRVLLVGWSAGGLCALGGGARCSGSGWRASASSPPCRRSRPMRTRPSSPRSAPARRGFAELAREVPAAELARGGGALPGARSAHAERSPRARARGGGGAGRRELAAGPRGGGGPDRRGWRRAWRRAARAWSTTWRGSSSRASTSRLVPGPVRTFHGGEDGISPPEVGAWLVARLPERRARPVTAAPGHHLLFPRWRGILRALQRDAGI